MDGLHIPARRRFLKLAALSPLTLTTPAMSFGPEPFEGFVGASDQYPRFEVLSGLATHVGHAYYPWERTISMRQRWGDIRPDFQIEKRGHLAAFHHPDYQKSRLYMGRRAWVVSIETGRMLWFDLVDVMGAEHGEGTLGWKPGVDYRGRVLDLTPEGFGWLLGWPDGPRDRGGQHITMLIPHGQNEYVWPVYT